VPDFHSLKNTKKPVLYDTTLRDGAQTEGVNFSLEDKLAIAKRLSDFGFSYVEGGWPGSNPRDMQFFSDVKKLGLRSRIAAFGMTSPRPESDENVKNLAGSGAAAITIFGKAWDLHVRDVLKMSLDENVTMIKKTIDYLKSGGADVFFDAEHLFDGYKSDPDYALKVLDAASGAEVLVLCDTNGGAMPWEVDEITRAVAGRFKKPLGIHAHNDSGMAVMNSLTAMKNGIVHVQGTVNGLGERCGNMDWTEFLPVASAKLGMKLDVDMKGLSQLSKYIERMTGFSVARNKPFVGENAFRHKAGVHIDAVLKTPKAYEHVEPSYVGNTRSFSLSEQVGRAGVLRVARQYGYRIDKSHPVVAEAMRQIKEKQNFTDSELYLLLAKSLDKKQDPFELLDYETEISSAGKAKTEIKIRIGKEVFHEISDGVGPVHSLDLALRKALGRKYNVEKLQLTNYRVRILNQEKATAASVEVFIEFRANGDTWSTSGVSDDLIKASEEALIKGYRYYLVKNKSG